MKSTGIKFFVYGTLRSRGKHWKRAQELGGILIRPCFINGYLLGVRKPNSVRPYLLPAAVTNRVEGELIEFPVEALSGLMKFERCSTLFPAESDTILDEVDVMWPRHDGTLSVTRAFAFCVGRDIHKSQTITSAEAL